MSALGRNGRRAVGLAGVSLLTAAVLFVAGAEIRAQAPEAERAQTVTGTVRDYTYAPKGEMDGAVLDDGTVIHWPPHMQDRFAEVVKRGDRVRIEGRMETGPRGDTHLEVLQVANLRSKVSQSNDDPPPPPTGRGPRGRGRRPAPPPPPPEDREMKTVTGKVRNMTTAPKGEIDGALLDDGTLIHWPPHMQDRFQEIVAPGDRVRVRGRMETGRRGDTHLEVATVTNLRSNASRDNDGDVRPPRGPRAAAAPPADPEQRIRELEQQVQELRREVERLRRK
jgi:single-stranded DNA-binding protein